MGEVKKEKKGWREDQGLELATADFLPGGLALQVALGLDSANLFDLGTSLAGFAKADELSATLTPLGALGLDLAVDFLLPALACGSLTLLDTLEVVLALGLVANPALAAAVPLDSVLALGHADFARLLALGATVSLLDGTAASEVLGTSLALGVKFDELSATLTPLGALGLDLAVDFLLPALACGSLTLLVPLEVEGAALNILLVKSATLDAEIFAFGFALLGALDASDLGLPLKSDLCKCGSCECKQCEEGDSE